MKFINKFFGKDIFSIYLTGKSIHVAGVMINETGQREVVYTENINFPTGSFKDNLIINPKAIAQKILLRVQKIEAKNCMFILPAEQTYEFFFAIPTPEKPKKGDKQKIKSMDDIIEDHIRANIPIPFQDLNYKYLISTYGKTTVCSVSAVASDIVEDYYDFLKMCKLNPVAIEPEYCSLLRNMNLPDQSEGCIVLDITPDKISWFGLVDEHRVDSSIIFRNDSHVRTPAEILRSDLQQSIENFHPFKKTKTNKKISTIYVSHKGKVIPDDLIKAIQSVADAFELKVEIIDTYKMVPEDERYTPDDFKICLGGALQTFEPKKFSMNFMEKNLPIQL